MDYITFFRSYRDAIKALPPDMRVEVYDAMFDYALDGTEPQLSGIPFAVFSLMRPNIDASNKIKNKNIQNGVKGGRPKSESKETTTEEEPKENPPKTQIEPTPQPNENPNETQEKGGVGVGVGVGNMEVDRERARKPRFTPPTVEEVEAYCQERRNHVDPQRFIDHYTANGWMRSKTKISDWKACVRTWEQRDGPITPAKGQRPCSEPGSDLIAKFMGGGG